MTTDDKNVVVSMAKAELVALMTMAHFDTDVDPDGISEDARVTEEQHDRYSAKLYRVLGPAGNLDFGKKAAS